MVNVENSLNLTKYKISVQIINNTKRYNSWLKQDTYHYPPLCNDKLHLNKLTQIVEKHYKTLQVKFQNNKIIFEIKNNKLNCAKSSGFASGPLYKWVLSQLLFTVKTSISQSLCYIIEPCKGFGYSLEQCDCFTLTVHPCPRPACLRLKLYSIQY